MILYLSVAIFFNAIFSLIEFRKFKIKNSMKSYIPIDIQIEFIIGFFLFLFYIFKKLNSFKSILIPNNNKSNYSYSLRSNFLNFTHKRTFLFSKLFMKKYKTLVESFN